MKRGVRITTVTNMSYRGILGEPRKQSHPDKLLDWLYEFDAYICESETILSDEFGGSDSWEVLAEEGNMPSIYYYLQRAINERESELMKYDANNALAGDVKARP